VLITELLEIDNLDALVAFFVRVEHERNARTQSALTIDRRDHTDGAVLELDAGALEPLQVAKEDGEVPGEDRRPFQPDPSSVKRIEPPQRVARRLKTMREKGAEMAMVNTVKAVARSAGSIPLMNM